MGKGKRAERQKADKRKARRKKAEKAERKHIKAARASFQRAHQLISTMILVKELGTIMRRDTSPKPAPKPDNPPNPPSAE
jgi:hypothetical protein